MSRLKEKNPNQEGDVTKFSLHVYYIVNISDYI